ncbi:MAG: hypothetical protein M1376_06410 [Planctomycetes bacterium]|nr:hypothetical protein [Planctomycetota bacterium]
MAKYKEALNARGIKNILMWLVAPLVPGAIREFLDGIGIEYSEIHEATFKEVAERHAYALRDHAPTLGSAKQADTFRNPKTNAAVRSHNGKFRNSLTPEFRSKLDRLKDSFPNGYRFLSYPVHNTTRIWLHSSVNVHIYCGDSFIAYVKVGGDTIEISPRFNNQISGGTHDRNEILFSKIDGLIAKHDGFKKGWVTQRYDSGAYVLRQPAPQEFFDDLLHVIEEGQAALEKKV